MILQIWHRSGSLALFFGVFYFIIEMKSTTEKETSNDKTKKENEEEKEESSKLDAEAAKAAKAAEAVTDHVAEREGGDIASGSRGRAKFVGVQAQRELVHGEHHCRGFSGSHGRMRHEQGRRRHST